MRNRAVVCVLISMATLCLGCTTSVEPTVSADRADTGEPEPINVAPPTSAEAAPAPSPTVVPEISGCDVGLQFEATDDTEMLESATTDSLDLAEDADRYDNETWVVANTDDPEGLRFQIWRFNAEYTGDETFDGDIDGFRYRHYGNEDRSVFNSVAGRLADDPAPILVLTLNGSTQDTFDFLGSVGDVIAGASSIGQLDVVRSGVPRTVLETATFVEQFRWRDNFTTIRALHVCGPAVGEDELDLADALTITSPLNATRTSVTGEESLTPISIGEADGYLLDIDEGSNDDYLVGIVGSPERAIVFTIIDSGADLDLGLSIVERLSLEPN